LTIPTKTISATACANIALIKYWGKRDIVLNLPAVGSISLTLEALQTKTSVCFDPKLKRQQHKINAQTTSRPQLKRVEKFLDLLRHETGLNLHARVESFNNFPTGAGLASSASAFAALGLAATRALGLNYSQKELSVLARKGSGSAARSVYGGFVEMRKGINPDGEDAYAVQLQSKEYWDLRVLILVTSEKEKHISSTEAMKICAKTSPYYKKWIDESDADLSGMRTAIEMKDIEKLGELAEYSTFKMHALMISAWPAILYWNAKTVELIHQVQQLRKKGIPAFVTIDAGPQIKVITLPDYTSGLKDSFRGFNGIVKIIESRLGGDAEIQE
jgi:diphosphomevalonate decarboxylase